MEPQSRIELAAARALANFVAHRNLMVDLIKIVGKLRRVKVSNPLYEPSVQALELLANVGFGADDFHHAINELRKLSKDV